MASIDERISRNFRVAKGAAILVVVSGHFLHITGFWMLVTVGLFIFGFSSGFFTSAKYCDHFRLRPFWLRKLGRLGPDLLAINAFLLVLFLVQGRSGIWQWETLLSVLGIKGFLTWFGLPNPSPFGAGVWFLTLLLIFYAGYPLLRLALRSSTGAVAVGAATLLAALWLQRYAPMGHMLWLTAWSFILGAVVHRLSFEVPSWVSGASACLLAATLALLNMVVKWPPLNFYLLIGLCVSAALCTKDARPAAMLLSPLGFLSGCLLEIYLLHPYLLIQPTGDLLLDFAASLALVIAVSWVLAVMATKLRRCAVFRDRTTQPVALLAEISHHAATPYPPVEVDEDPPAEANTGQPLTSASANGPLPKRDTASSDPGTTTSTQAAPRNRVRHLPINRIPSHRDRSIGNEDV